MNECTFYELCDLLNSHYNLVLNSIGFLIVVFGLVIPIFATLVQHKNLKAERERFEKDAERKFAELKKHRKRMLKQKKQIKDLRKLLSNAYIALAQFYLNEAGRVLEEWSDEKDREEKIKLIRAELKYVGSTLHCGVNSRNRRQLIVLMKTFDRLPEIILRDHNLFKESVDSLFREYPKSNFFVRQSDLVEMVGADNPIYQNFIEKFKPLLDLTEDFYNA